MLRQVARLIFAYQEVASSSDSHSVDCQTREEDPSAGCDFWVLSFTFWFCFPAAAALGSSLSIICLWEWEMGILDPTHILNFSE